MPQSVERLHTLTTCVIGCGVYSDPTGTYVHTVTAGPKSRFLRDCRTSKCDVPFRRDFLVEALDSRACLVVFLIVGAATSQPISVSQILL